MDTSAPSPRLPVPIEAALARIERVLPAALAGRLHQLVRYGTVSLIATATSMTVLGVLVWTGAMPAAWANVVATAVGTIPSFELNRRWVWGKRGARSLAGEIGPFCVLSFAGLGLSTAAVGAASVWATTSGFAPAAHTAVVEMANVAAFGSLWVLQFLILDRVLFAHRSDPQPVHPTGTTELAPSTGEEHPSELLAA